MKQNPKWNVGCMNGKKVVSSRKIAEYLKMPYFDFVLALANAQIDYYSYKNKRGELDEVEEMYFELTAQGHAKDIWMTSNGLIWGLAELDKFPKLNDDPLSKLMHFLSKNSSETGVFPQGEES